MALTNTGWVSKRYPEIFAELQNKLRSNIDPNLDVSSTSVLGQITAIFAAEIASQYDLGQAVYDSGNKDKAEGKNLDDLAALVGLTRNVPTPSNGTILLVGASNTTIPSSSLFGTSDNKNTIAITSSVVIDSAACYKTEVQVTSVVDNTLYSLSINSSTFTFTSGTGATAASILGGLNSAINSFLVANPEAGFTSSVVGNRLVVTTISYRNGLNVVFGARLAPDKITKAVNGVVTVNGPVAILPETVKVILSPISGLNSVSNPNEFQYGRNVESDEELRIRMTQSVQIAGKATVPAIRAAIGNITGVSSVSIIENTTPLPDVNGMPPSSYQVVVEGGDDQTIANTIWETKPAGIQTYSINGVDGLFVVEDNQGNPQAVYFTRPIPKYMWVNVTASLYNEEAFPTTTGPEAVKKAVVDYGKTLGVGKDVICKRFYGSVYQNVSGIGNIVITAAYTTSPTSVPSPGDYAEIIPVANVEVSRWDTSRVSFTLV